MSLEITEGQLLVGNGAAPPKSCPIFPEFSFAWIANELREQPIRERPHNVYEYDDATEQALLEIEDDTVDQLQGNGVDWTLRYALDALLDAHRIAVMPGESFGRSAAGHIRVAVSPGSAPTGP